MNDATLIQSYVRERFFVSTINRASSAMVMPPLRFHETIVWHWNPEDRGRGEMISVHNTDFGERSAFEQHMRICQHLMNGGDSAELEDE